MLDGPVRVPVREDVELSCVYLSIMLVHEGEIYLRDKPHQGSLRRVVWPAVNVQTVDSSLVISSRGAEYGCSPIR